MYKTWTLEDVIMVLKDLDKKYNLHSLLAEVNISNRMSRCKGKYTFRLDKNRETVTLVRFAFASNLLNGSYSEEVVREVIMHEYAHYLAEDDYKKNQGHNAKFKAMCRYLGITDSTYFEHNNVENIAYKEPVYKFEIVCDKCGGVVAKRNRIVGDKFDRCISKCCKAKLNVRKI